MSQRLFKKLRDWADSALAFFYPENCQICRAAHATPRESYLCGHCRDQVAFVEPPFCERCGKPFQGNITISFECGQCARASLAFERARSAVTTREPTLELIHRYKYQRALWFEPFLSSLLVSRAVPDLGAEHWDCLVPVPLHPIKQREREFNQAERLAGCLGRATRIPLRTDLIRRVLHTPSQTHLSREERAENMRHAFAPCPNVRLSRLRVVLVDDVFTTGATTNACARALRDAGASTVRVWTLARGV